MRKLSLRAGDAVIVLGGPAMLAAMSGEVALCMETSPAMTVAISQPAASPEVFASAGRAVAVIGNQAPKV